MTRRIVESQSRRYTFSSDDEVLLSDRIWAVAKARVVDEITLEPLRSTIMIKTDIAGLMPRAASDGFVGLVGRPLQAFPNLATQNYSVDMTFMAEGYIPSKEEVTIAQNQNVDFPNIFRPADEIEIRMHREPIVVRGRIVTTDASATTPISGASITLIGIWRTLPPANAVPSNDPPHVVALQPPLYSPRLTGTSHLRRREMDPVVGQDKCLLEDVPKNSNTLRLSDRIDLSPGDILMINTDDPDLLEYQVVEDVSGYSTPDQPATITLTYPVYYPHRKNVITQQVIPQAPGRDNQFEQNSIIGDTCIFLHSMDDLDAANVVEISGGGDPEYHVLSHFSVTTNTDGYYRLPPMSRIAKAKFRISNGGVHNPIEVDVIPDYSKREHRIDFVF